MSKLIGCVTLCFIALHSASTYAEQTPPAPTAILITIGPGDAPWEKYGHNMLWLRDASRGIDLCYNWGLFDFEQPGFVKNFVQGRMKYWMDAFPPGQALGAYTEQKRAVRLQLLRLTPAQVGKLVDLCEENRKPQNAEYLYDYFKDNCSTRVRDVIASVQNDPNEFAHALRHATGSGQTYRQHALRLMQDDAPLSLGIDFTLGRMCDVPLNKWDEAFLPAYLADAFAPFADELVKPWTASHVNVPTAAPVWWPRGLLIGVVSAGVIIFLARWKRGAIIAITIVWGLSAFAGLFLIGMWTLTDHRAAYANQHLLQFSPLLCVGLVMLCRKSWREKVWYVAVITIAISVLAAVLFGVIGVLNQSNATFTALAIPLHAGAGIAAFRLRPRLTQSGVSDHGD